MRYPPCHDRRQTGFTLVELMITVLIASILLAMAVPSFNQMMATSRLATQSNELIGALNTGRSEAIRRNRIVTLCRVASGADTDTTCLTGAGQWAFWILAYTPAATPVVLQRGTLNTYGNTVRVTSTLSSERILFGPDGLARTGGALVADDTYINVCSTRLTSLNARQVKLSSGSRVSTTKVTATC